MSYRFQEHETVPDGVKRIALEQIDKALELTTAGSKAGKNLDKAIHDTRVSCKKLRGLLRLVRFGLDDETFKSENVYYRDVNRSLSSVRQIDRAIRRPTCRARFPDNAEVFDSLKEQSAVQ